MTQKHTETRMNRFKQGLTQITVNKKEHHNSHYGKAAFGTPCILNVSTCTAFHCYELFMGNFLLSLCYT